METGTEHEIPTFRSFEASVSCSNSLFNISFKSQMAMNFTKSFAKAFSYGFIMFAAAGMLSSCEKADTPEGEEFGPDPDAPFVCEVPTVSASMATVIITPDADFSGYYYFDIMEKDVFIADFDNDREGMIERLEMQIAAIGEQNIELGNVASMEEFVQNYIVSEGSESYVYKGLNPLTEYCVWACGMDLQGKATTQVFVIGEFTTIDVEHSGMTFDIAYDPASYTLTITPSASEAYVWGRLSAEDYQTYYNSSAEAAVKDLIATYIGEDALESNLVTGPASKSMILNAAIGENVVVAAGYNDGITTDIAEYKFNFEGNPSSTIEEDVDTTLGLMTSAFYSNWGELKDGLDQVTMVLSDYESLEQVYIDLWMPHGETISGNYTINNTNEARTVIAGRATESLTPSFFGRLDEESWEIEKYALLESGTMSVSGDDMMMMYTVNIDAMSGDISVKVNFSGMMFSASSASAGIQPRNLCSAIKLSEKSRTDAFAIGKSKVCDKVIKMSSLKR